MGDPDARKRATTAIEVLTSAQEEVYSAFKATMELFRQSSTPNSEWAGSAERRYPMDRGNKGAYSSSIALSIWRSSITSRLAMEGSLRKATRGAIG